MKFLVRLTHTQLAILEMVLIEARDASNDIHPSAITELIEKFKLAKVVKKRKK